MIEQPSNGVVSFRIFKQNGNYHIRKMSTTKTTFFQEELTLTPDQKYTFTVSDPYEMVWLAKDAKFNYEDVIKLLDLMTTNK